MPTRGAAMFLCLSLLIAGCSHEEPTSAAFGIAPPAAWGPVIDDKMDQWSGEMAGSTQEVLDQLVVQYKKWSKSTEVEEKAKDHAVIRFDFADLVHGMALDAGTAAPAARGRPLPQRMLIDVKPSGRDFAVRLRSFDLRG